MKNYKYVILNILLIIFFVLCFILDEKWLFIYLIILSVLLFVFIIFDLLTKRLKFTRPKMSYLLIESIFIITITYSLLCIFDSSSYFIVYILISLLTIKLFLKEYSYVEDSLLEWPIVTAKTLPKQHRMHCWRNYLCSVNTSSRYRVCNPSLGEYVVSFEASTSY